MQADISKSPYGLNGGIYLNGSTSKAINNGYCYYPLSASEANIKFSNIDSGSSINMTFSPGIPIYGIITSVTQSSGISIVYYAGIEPIKY